MELLHDLDQLLLDLVLAYQHLQDHPVLLLRGAPSCAVQAGRQALNHAVPEEHAPVHGHDLVVLLGVDREAEALDHALVKKNSNVYNHKFHNIVNLQDAFRQTAKQEHNVVSGPRSWPDPQNIV